MGLRFLAFFSLLSLSITTYAYEPSKILLTELSGKQIAFTSLQGKWVMINYWASWCQPCLDEIHELNTFYHQNQHKVALFAVNYEGLSSRKQARLVESYHLTYPSLRHDPAKSLELEALVGVPATYIFNPQGIWVDTLYGPQTQESLNKVIATNT